MPSGDTDETIIVTLLSGNVGEVKMIVDLEKNFLAKTCATATLLARPTIEADVLPGLLN